MESHSIRSFGTMERAAGSNGSAGGGRSGGSGGSGGRVLIVDDDDVIRSCVAATLQDEGYEVLHAAHGAAALDLLRRLGREQPDVILLDMRMPVMDGWAFAQRYRQLPLPQAPIVVMTAAPDAAARAAEIEVRRVLSKPFDLDELVAVVHQSRASGGTPQQSQQSVA